MGNITIYVRSEGGVAGFGDDRRVGDERPLTPVSPFFSLSEFIHGIIGLEISTGRVADASLRRAPPVSDACEMEDDRRRESIAPAILADDSTASLIRENSDDLPPWVGACSSFLSGRSPTVLDCCLRLSECGTPVSTEAVREVPSAVCDGADPVMSCNVSLRLDRALHPAETLKVASSRRRPPLAERLLQWRTSRGPLGGRAEDQLPKEAVRGGTGTASLPELLCRWRPNRGVLGGEVGGDPSAPLIEFGEGDCRVESSLGRAPGFVRDSVPGAGRDSDPVAPFPLMAVSP